MTTSDHARRYLAAIPPAISGSGGHKQTLLAAAALVRGFGLSATDALPLLAEYSAHCSPPWAERELRHKLAEADRTSDPQGRPRGYLLRFTETHPVYRPAQHTARHQSVRPNPKAAPKPTVVPRDPPKPIPDGARELLRACFSEGDGVRIASARLNEEEREIPDGQGVTLSREDWLARLDAKKGDPNGIWKSSTKTGIYVGLNPLRPGGTKDADVTSFRHALLEFDHMSIAEQWGIYIASNIPCAAIISSGGKSLHAWVKVGAKDRREYDERIRILYAQFADFGLDEKNKNPSRLSRLPNCERFSKRQELIALNVGAESFSTWLADKETGGIGKTVTCEQLVEFSPEFDDSSILGNRWICKGGSCLWVGQSGIGKSSLSVQAAVSWAIGRPFFGVAPARPLKSIFIQAENDMGDLAEMLQGVLAGVGIAGMVGEFPTLNGNLIFIRDTTHTGFEFTQCVQRLIDKHHPDLVWMDPLLSFIGADISRQEVCSEFLRNWLAPIAESTGVVWMMVHHTGKPAVDPKSKSHWQSADFSYMGIGSSELTNWARAVCVLRQIGGAFELKFAKRGKRAEATDLEGKETCNVWLKQAETGILWTQIAEPEVKHTVKTEKEPKLSIPDRVAAMNTSSFLAACSPEGEGFREIIRRLQQWAANDAPEKTNLTHGSAQRCIDKLVSNGKIGRKGELYIKGKNA